MKATRFLSKLVVETSFADFPEEVVERSKACLLDWLGATIGGMQEPSSAILLDLVREQGGEGQATVLGHGLKTTALNAALVNGTMSHALDYDDAHSETRNHTSAPLVSALLAVAEHRHLSGRDLITAYILGFEASTRIGLALGRKYYEKGWHTTSVLGRFGAAVGTGRLMGFNEGQVANALGLAATQSGGIRSVFGTMGKPFHAGKAAMDGLLAAMLSGRGFTGPQDVLDDHSEYVNLFSSEYNPDLILSPIAKNYHIMSNTIKFHAACLLLHPVIDGLLAIRNRHRPDPEDIELIDLEVAPLCLAVNDNPGVDTGMQGKFSIFFCSALALARGSVGSQEFSRGALDDSQVRMLMRRVRVKADPALKETEAKVAVHASGNRVFGERVTFLKGGPRNPGTFDEIVEKFLDLSKGKIPEKNLREAVARVRELETVPDIAPLIGLCRRNPEPLL